MVLTLYGSAMSTARVHVVLLELALEYKHIPIDISKGEQKHPSYMKMQPFGKVPVLDDDGLVIYESRAICRYLARKYQSGTKFMPDDDDFEAYAKFEQAASIEISYVASAAECIGTEMVIKKSSPPLWLFPPFPSSLFPLPPLSINSHAHRYQNLGPPDLQRVAQAEADLRAVFKVYEDILGKQRYLAGDEISLVDLFHLPHLEALWVGGYEGIWGGVWEGGGVVGEG
ncbi:Thioredoxin-like protein [Glarea lozoyensis ATCC 20868]|uniref:glutathione transferase n=1 Tax=Glarea lozoyensis (strain ATCC 20868 / MF5171) TaxID=1116229 RepID=S3D663_GLAL2|nr:Thioredoxin-like protein [Glarea lozoyensis ATCC 20868]EPE33962.1 Thioredoxin-like protein [Glarea lozoyensis ATCC 20868]